MDNSTLVLASAAVGIGAFHTLIGPDHYLPFIVMSKARGWSLRKTSVVTALCGVGHVLSSVVLGFVGIAAGVALEKLEWIEGFRGSVAAWLLIGFGIVYAMWGLKRAWSGKTHTHAHLHSDGDPHHHEHSHTGEHTHVHTEPTRKSITPWVLFVIFIFGPCEILIPMLMYPAAQHNYGAVALIAALFGLATIATMLTLVTLATLGIRRIRLGFAERYAHVVAGLMIAVSGLAIQVLGL